MSVPSEWPVSAYGPCPLLGGKGDSKRAQSGQCHVSLRSGVTPGFIGHGELRGALQALFGRPPMPT